MKMWKKAASVMLASAMVVSLAACGSSGNKSGGSSDSDTFKIGGIGPTTGDAAIYGTAVKNGIQLAVDEINAAGGINGKQIEYKFEDDQADSEKSVNAYNTLKDWGMQALIGTTTSTPCTAVVEETHSDNMFQLTPSATAVDSIQYDNAFRMCFSDPNQGSASADYIAENKLATKVAIIYNSSDTYSSGIYQTFATEAKAKGLYEIIGAAIDDKYIAQVKAQVVNQGAIDRMQDQITIVYTPLHGTGNIPARRVMKELGFTHVYVVPQQELPDGDFPTVSYPNPEAKEAFELGLALAKEKNADLVLATDPDADRLGVYAKDTKTGEYVSFTGNMSGMLIAEYILRERKATGTLPANGALVETIVTTDMAKAIAKAYGVKLIEVLTGFKYIGEQIKFFEQQNSYEYVFGLEESYGCLAGTYARDKDACVAVMMLCEVAAWCKSNGITLWDAMVSLYETYGYYKEGLETMTLKGMDGAEKIQSMMNEMRNNPPKKIGAWDVLALRDYKKDTRTDMTSGEVTPTGLPESNVLYYELSNNAWCCVRPSGTEPKIKFYFGVVGMDIKDSEKKLDELRTAMLTYAGE